MGVLQLIASRNFITLNKELIKLLGIDEAIMIGELASEYDYWEKQGKIENGYFFSTAENVEENTTLSEYKQRKALNKLKALNLVSVEVKGMPAKRYIKIQEEELLKFLGIQFLKNYGTSSEKIKELEPKKLRGNNNKDNNNKNNNKTSKKESKKTFDEMIEHYTSNVDLQEEIKNHLATRKVKGGTLTNRAIELALRKLDQLTEKLPINDREEEKIKIVQQSIERGWIGFFEVQKPYSKSNKSSGNMFFDLLKEEGKL